MPNKVLRTLFIVNGMFVLAQNMLGPLYAVYVQGVGLSSVVLISASWAIFLTTATIGNYLLMKIEDGVNREDLFLASLLLRVGVWIMYIFVQNFWMLALSQVILGIGEALGTSSFEVIFAEHLDKNRHVHEYAEYQLINNAALAVAALLGGLIVKQFGFISLFVLMAILTGLAFGGAVYLWKGKNV